MKKALVVDDSKAIRMILGRILKDLGYEVREAGDGRQALDLIAAEHDPIELALVDWNMPVMNGLDLVVEIRKRPELCGLALVMVTSETEMGHIGTALEAGANEYIMKPFTKEIVQEKLELVGLNA